MQLSELVKNYSINTVSQKSNIPVEVLDKLVDCDWESLQRAKVNGFLNIIEREFEVDLSEQREEAKEFYEAHKKIQPNRPIDLVDAQSVGGNGGKFIANLFTILMVAIVAYAGWFYLAKSDDSSMKKEDNKSSGMFQDSINAAKSLIGIANTKESNNTKTEVKVEQKADSNITASETRKSEATTAETTATESEVKQPEATVETEALAETNESSSQERVVKKFDINIASSEKNEGSEETNNSVAVESTTKLEDTPKSNNETDIKANVESLLEENSSSSAVESNVSKEVNITQEAQGIDVATLDSNTTQSAEVLENSSLSEVNKITITPTVKKIWIGIYNLKTKKRVVQVATRAYDYDTSGGDVAIATGHSRFKIATDKGASSVYHDAGKRKYLLISKDGIKVLTKQEYKKVTNRRAW